MDKQKSIIAKSCQNLYALLVIEGDLVNIFHKNRFIFSANSLFYLLQNKRAILTK